MTRIMYGKTYFERLKEFRIKFAEAKLELVREQIRTEKLRQQLTEERIFNVRNK